MISRRGVIGLFIACVGCAATACDNSKAVAPAAVADTVVVTRTDILVEDHVLEGSIRSDSGVAFFGLNVSGNPYSAGLFRAFFGFELAPIPTGSVVTSAHISITLCAISGTPFDSLGPLIAEHVDYGNGVSLSSYYITPLEATQYVVATAGAVGTTDSVDVTAAVAADVAGGRAHSEFRLRFANRDGDAANDGVAIVGASSQLCDAAINGITPVGSKPALTMTSHTERVAP
jgi:hypothetical protein